MRELKITKVDLRDRAYRSRYLVPNAVTLASMFCGFLCIIYATSARYEKAALAIAISIVLDGLDGRVARRLNATSKFGIEFDSFSDFVSFGVAPAILIYNWAFRWDADEFGVAVTFVYALCAASRLARFNISVENLRGFTGLPTPGAAGCVAALVNFVPMMGGQGADPTLLIPASSLLMLTLAYLMVSRLDFFSIKRLRIDRMHLATRIVMGTAIAITWYHPSICLLLLAFLYAASGPFGKIMRKGKPVAENTPSATAS